MDGGGRATRVMGSFSPAGADARLGSLVGSATTTAVAVMEEMADGKARGIAVSVGITSYAGSQPTTS